MHSEKESISSEGGDILGWYNNFLGNGARKEKTKITHNAYPIEICMKYNIAVYNLVERYNTLYFGREI